MEPIVFRKYDIYQLLFYCWFLIEEEINTDVCVYIIDYIVLLTKIRYTYFSLLQEASKYGGYAHSESAVILEYPLKGHPYALSNYDIHVLVEKNYRKLHIRFPSRTAIEKFHSATQNLYEIVSTTCYNGKYVAIIARVCNCDIGIWLTTEVVGSESLQNFAFVIKCIVIEPCAKNETTVCSYVTKMRNLSSREKELVVKTLINM